MKRLLANTILLALLSACTRTEPADLVIQGGKVYTLDPALPEAAAVAVKDGRIVFVGSQAESGRYIGSNSEVISLDGKTLTPGWIETHGHFMGMGQGLMQLDLMKATSFEQIADMVREEAGRRKPGEWILGRGWHQDKWDSLPPTMIRGFPTHHLLSEAAPANPVFLDHASGHAALANAKAMEIAGVNPLAREKLTSLKVEGGEVIVDNKGNPTGAFNERAQGLIERHIPSGTEEDNLRAFELAVAEAQKSGITGFHDAGTGRGTIAFFERMKREGKMGVRLYVMVAGRDPQLVHEWFSRGPLIDSTDYLLTVRAVKLNCDGALGSWGAWLLEPYTDHPGEYGHETLPMDSVLSRSRMALQAGFQVCSHAIGDRANREVLDRYEQAFGEFPALSKDARFRIEHAQHVDPADLPRFASLGVIPAMQAIHLSSDRPWAIVRLGDKRIREGAYMWQTLLKSGARVINGTDVPVEPIDPIASFYASVTRKTLKAEPEGGFEPEECMTREQALRSYTLDAAYGSFEEGVKGSIEVGKLADFTVFSQDLMTVPEEKILDTKVEMTVLGGKVVYRRGR
jgi:hypothetical protein